ncbi:VOC family protein [Actinopolymorpha alba]|uniref:VOC family protein n=1 Tax=Actinopolymorpha alba TaxID=533267 RepID=UPI000371E04E|nr:VOC family protein [Actinopolymorpha alba]
MVQFQITVDCTDRDRLARFWASALGYQPQDPPAGFADWRAYWLSVSVPGDEISDIVDTIVDPAGHGPRIWFQEVPEGKTTKNRLHIDIDASGRIGGRTVPIEEIRHQVDATVERLTSLGATTTSVADFEGYYCVVMQDPEGNEFCVG